MDTALKFLAAKARTVREVERHLDDSQFGEIEVQQVIDRLLELKYLDDAAYAEEFVRTRLSSKPLSRNKLKEQLLQHELALPVISEALAGIDDAHEYGNALQIAQKYARQLSRYEPEELKERLMQRLVARGFAYDDSRRAIEQATREPI
ncbi:MAG TPA: regulatory protein RecX [Feifaniaceae bacterium]|nr:regulatory protein RecX [Feifaniaceae bacterium]